MVESVKMLNDEINACGKIIADEIDANSIMNMSDNEFALVRQIMRVATRFEEVMLEQAEALDTIDKLNKKIDDLSRKLDRK